MTVPEIIAGLEKLYGPPMGLCAEYTAAFAEHFPELKRVKGFVTLRSGLRRSHWWLETADGKIVDPTASQFETEYFWYAGIASYEPFNDDNPEHAAYLAEEANYV